ncbi:hypothetical protein PYW08_000074 [Mythimna loreyi]|uniref:Uncharacterized protein n=1 Tax=Mythimna loreyi TaxID=667449 RepID=A0ACC2RBI5_9NEOP|nr:hypothetical protein PYW08_000074 [Mythimna loreyi]
MCTLIPYIIVSEIYLKMNNSAAKVGEIFREAGTAFTKLSEMTLMLQPMDDATPGSKWSEEEVEMLRGCVNQFAVELNKISQHIKNRTITQIRTTLKKKAFEDAGIPIPTRQVTLNMLNASENEDVDGLGSDVKLEFESTNDEVAT